MPEPVHRYRAVSFPLPLTLCCALCGGTRKSLYWRTAQCAAGCAAGCADEPTSRATMVATAAVLIPSIAVAFIALIAAGKRPGIGGRGARHGRGWETPMSNGDYSLADWPEPMFSGKAGLTLIYHTLIKLRLVGGIEARKTPWPPCARPRCISSSARGSSSKRSESRCDRDHPRTQMDRAEGRYEILCPVRRRPNTPAQTNSGSIK